MSAFTHLLWRSRLPLVALFFFSASRAIHDAMANLLPELKAASSTAFDIISLGEVMLRLDPGEGRIHTTRTLNVWEGGGEYNVARGLRRCFNQRAAIVTALADNPVGRLVEDLI